MEKEIVNSVLDTIKESGIISYFNMNASMPSPDHTTLIEMSMFPKQIFVEDNKICYKDDTGDTICCPYIDDNISDAGYWLSDKIPSPPFDILQSGNLRKAEEAECFYICNIITNILNDSSFTEQFKDCIKSYDFEHMDGVDGSLNFLSLLKEWQELQSIVINVIVSATKYSITNQKKESEAFLKEGLSTIELDALRDLALNIKSVNFNYSTGPLSPQSVKQLTKIEILKLIDERNAEINKILNASKYGDLYKTFKLSSEYLSPITKKKIVTMCISEVEKLYNTDPTIKSNYGEITSIISKVKRRAFKLAVNSLIRENVLKYIDNREGYTLPRKG